MGAERVSVDEDFFASGGDSLLAIRLIRRLQEKFNVAVPVRDLFETHLTVVDLRRSMTFFGQVLGLELAEVFLERKAAF